MGLALLLLSIVVVGQALSFCLMRRQALAFENIYDGVIIIDLEGQIIDWNPAAKRMFSYSKSGFLDKTLGNLPKTKAGATLTGKIINRVQNQKRWFREIYFVCKDETQGFSSNFVVHLQNKFSIQNIYY